MLADYRGRPLVTWAVQAALDTQARRVAVVVAPGAAGLRACLTAAYPAEVAGKRLSLSACPDADEGMGASLRHGVAACAPDSEGVFVFLGDMPEIPSGVGAALTRALRQGAAVAAPSWRGRRGHPVLFSADLRPRLLAAAGDAGMRAVLAGAGCQIVLVEAPGPGVLFDVDTPETLAATGRQLEGRD